MATYRLGPVIGKVGGVEVQKIPVDIVAAGANKSVVVMRTVDVPAGETWLVALTGDLATGASVTSSLPEILIGEVVIGPPRPSGIATLVAEVTGTAEITLKRNTSLNTDAFVGHVYTAPLTD